MTSNLLNHYLREFNAEYLRTPADRRRLAETLATGFLTLLLILATALVLLLL